VGAAVGLGVGAGVGFGVAEAEGFSVGFSVGLAVADAAADGAALSAASGGRTRKTFGEPLRSWRVTASLRASIRAAPSMALMNAVSWAITSSAHAIRVVASWPIRTTLPFVP
jgi:hypothetical protein